MTEALVYILFSIVEGLIIVYFSFGLFRIRAIDYWKEIVVTVSTISAATYYYSMNETLASIAPMLNIIALFLALVLVFRISLLHSLYISVTGFMALLAVQVVFITLASIVLNIELTEIRTLDSVRYFLQIAGDITILVVSILLKKYRLWFTFVPYSPELTFKLTKSNLSILMSCVIGIVILTSLYNFDNLIIGTVLSLMCIANLITIGVKKERS